MNKLKRFLRYLIITFLFFAALYSTFTAITNLTYQDIKQVIALDPSYAADEMSEKEAHLKKKTLNTKTERKKYISSDEIEGPQSIEEVIDFEQYPKRKVIATGYTAGVESTGKHESHP